SYDEILNNVVKHAKASEVLISLDIQDDNKLLLTVQDNGVGFDPVNQVKKEESYGLDILEHSTTRPNTEFILHSKPHEGTIGKIIIILG
ncbi:MAG TPA: sensor histidine kinase, partial [Spirochaetes bacterium]|nr:sensor histidine kinase [Spirochaetota bacterium]